MKCHFYAAGDRVHTVFESLYEPWVRFAVADVVLVSQ